MINHLDKVDFEVASPNAVSLIQSLRAFGYDISTAIADLIDNCITAHAHNISILFEWNEGNPFIAIIDDGIGMSEDELSNAMRLGSKNPRDERDLNDLGRFGLGMKTASLSQCKRFTVICKQNENINIRCWDLDVIDKSNDWNLLKKGSDCSIKLIKNYLSKQNSGTIILWENIDKIIPMEAVDDPAYQDEFLNSAKRVKSHISKVFSSFMQGRNKILFSMNERLIDPWDPFMTENENTSVMPEEILYVRNKEVRIKPFILPHNNKLSSDEFQCAAGENGWLESQGFYVYRNKRLIIFGSWLLPEFQKKEQYRLARIRIDIENNLDDEWNIDVKKSVASPPISIQSEIRRIATKARNESSRIFKHRGKKLARNINKDQAFVWSQNSRRGKLGYTINRNHFFVKELLQSDSKKEIENLIELIEETVPIPLIISDTSEKPDEMRSPFEGKEHQNMQEMMGKLYYLYVEKGITPSDAIKNIAGCEPFVYCPIEVELFREKIGVKE